MLKKFRNRTENKHTKMNDSALRDIIPSDDVSYTEESHQPRLLKICKIFLTILILGLVAVGIVLLAFILIYSGKSFLTFILQATGLKLLSLSNATVQHENFTSISNEQNWQKITIPPVRTLSTILRTKQENKHLSTNIPIMKFDPTLNTIVNEQSSSIIMQTEISQQQSTILPSTTVNDQVYVTTSLEQRTTTTDSLTSTYFSSKIQDHETSTLKQIPLTTNMVRKPSQQLIQAYYKKLDEDNIIDDILFS